MVHFQVFQKGGVTVKGLKKRSSAGIMKRFTNKC